jgi:phospho-N-acetylmuramoyl-pentapeptide-transferase
MLYYLLVPLAKEHIVFNVFRYLTFRSFMALITALVISLMLGPWLIRRL